MGRFARKSERGEATPMRVPTTAPPFVGRARFRPRRPQTSEARDAPSPRAPSETKYFLLAVAALIGLGLGWLSGEAITGWLPRASSPPAIGEQTLAAGVAAGGSPAAAPAAGAESDRAAEPAAAPATVPDAGTAAATVAPPAPDDTPARVGRKGARRGYRRSARGNVFIRPFKVLRRLRVW